MTRGSTSGPGSGQEWEPGSPRPAAAARGLTVRDLGDRLGVFARLADHVPDLERDRLGHGLDRFLVGDPPISPPRACERRR